jgi:hypothetical protein
MSWEGQRLYDEAYHEAKKDTGPSYEHAPWHHRMSAAERMLQAADDMTDAVEARAVATGVNVTDIHYLVDRHLYG